MQTVALVAATALAGLANAYQAGYPIGVVNNEVRSLISIRIHV